MQKIEWNDNLRVGIQDIDRQHGNWIRLYNDVVDAVAEKHDQEQVVKVLGFLLDYTEEHFAAEEATMQAHGYPALAEHRLKHDELRKTVNDLVRDFRDEGVSRQLTDAVETLLGNWLVNHIQDVDKAFADYVHGAS